jgi:hypothetical protein
LPVASSGSAGTFKLPRRTFKTARSTLSEIFTTSSGIGSDERGKKARNWTKRAS